MSDRCNYKRSCVQWLRGCFLMGRWTQIFYAVSARCRLDFKAWRLPNCKAYVADSQWQGSVSRGHQSIAEWNTEAHCPGATLKRGHTSPPRQDCLHDTALCPHRRMTPSHSLEHRVLGEFALRPFCLPPAAACKPSGVTGSTHCRGKNTRRTREECCGRSTNLLQPLQINHP